MVQEVAWEVEFPLPVALLQVQELFPVQAVFQPLLQQPFQEQFVLF